jgi:DNA-binding XRE family transcriptional regulator
MKALKEVAPDAKLSALDVIHSGAGAHTVRPEITTEDAIAYTNYSPPALWAAPFSLLRVSLQNVPKEDTYVVHHGEELVVPITAPVTYAFFWSPGGKAPQRELVTVDPGTIAAVNPRLPHHGWAAKKAGTEAWIAIYHDPDSSIALDLETKIEVAREDAHSRRRFHSSDFSDPAQFALVAWGIADKIRNQRQRANLTIAQMAKLAGVDASHLSRIENASANVSLQMLLHICKFLRINLDSLIGSSRWNCRVHKLSDASTTSQKWFVDNGGCHQLRPSILQLNTASGGTHKSQVLSRQEELVSWIVLEGRMILEPAVVKVTDSDVSVHKAELLEPGSVVHFRKPVEAKVKVLDLPRILRIGLSRNTNMA